MSRNGTPTDHDGAMNATPAGETTGAKLKHLGISLLPLALFMASTLGTEYVTQRLSASQPGSTTEAVNPKAAAGPAVIPSPAVAKAPGTPPSNANPVQQPAAVANQAASPATPDTKRATLPPALRTVLDFTNALRDERSLLELSRLEAARVAKPIFPSIPLQAPAPVAVSAPVSAPVPAKISPPASPSGAASPPVAAAVTVANAVPEKVPVQAPVQAQVPSPVAAAPLTEPVTTHRSLTTIIDSAEPLSLGLKNDIETGTGGYAIIRGVPQSVILSHGISVGDDSWLIDGVDIPRTAIDLRGRATGKVVLDVAVLTASSALLHRENVTIEVKPAAVAASVMTAPVVPVANAEPVIQKPVIQPNVDTVAATPAVPAQPVPQVETAKPAVPAAPSPSVRISRETNLVPGRGGLLRLDIEPASAIPKGAYVVMLGLPADNVMSRGIPMGTEAWLLTLAELAQLEVRLPAKAAGTIKLAATLITVDGNLIAEDRYEIALRSPAFPAAAKSQPLAAKPPATPQVATAVPSQIVTRAIPAPATALAAPPANVPASNTTPGQVALTRARRMLDLGNIAAARPLLESSATEGSGDAAALLGASFDPDWLGTTGVLGISADATKARYWYDEARKLGVQNIERVTAAPKGR